MKNNTYSKKYAKYYDIFNQGKDYGREYYFLENVFKRYSRLKIIDVLDLGCGTGIHARHLSSKGYNVLGLDLSKEMIEIANSRAAPRNRFRVGDMSNFKLNKKFGAIICMFSALGYLTKNSQIRGFFKSVKEHLKSQGLLIVDVWNASGIMQEPPSSREKIVEKNDLRIIRRSFPNLISKNNIIEVKFNVKVFRDNNLIENYGEMHRVRFFFQSELNKYAKEGGFELVHICPSYEIDEELSENHWNMVLIYRLK